MAEDKTKTAYGDDDHVQQDTGVVAEKEITEEEDVVATGGVDRVIVVPVTCKLASTVEKRATGQWNAKKPKRLADLGGCC